MTDFTKYTLILSAYYTFNFNVCCGTIYLERRCHMIKYKIDLIQALKEAGYSTYKIRKEKTFTESQLQQMRSHKLLTQDAFNKLCTILNCQPGDILEYIPDETETDQE